MTDASIGDITEPRVSEPVRLVLRAAEDVRAENRDAGLYASHLLAGFAQRHGPMLERYLGGIDVARFVADLLRDQRKAGLQAGAVLDAAVQRARTEGREVADLRHLAASLADTLGLQAPPAPTAPTPGQKSTGRPAAAGIARTPTLDELGRDLTALARAGQLTAIVGREQQTAELVEVLCRRFKRNPLLVGPPGVGKTAIVEGLAQRIVARAVPAALAGVRLVEVSTAAIVARSPSLADLTRLVEALLREARGPNLIVFIDEFHAAVMTGGQDLGIASQLKPALARGEIACIGAMTEADYYRTVRADPALDRRFEPVRVPELDAEATTSVLRSILPTLLDGDESAVSEDVLQATVRLSGRYLHNRHFPDKAIDVLDRTVARARSRGEAPTATLVADVLGDMTGLPLGAQAGDVGARLDGLGDYLRGRVIGQDDAIEALTEALPLRVRGLDLRPERPNGVFLFTGPTGVGKTELARALAEHLFGSPERMVRLDMSEYADAHYAAKIVGSPPGYVGYDEGAPLLEAIDSRPFTVVLLDEIEKAHPQVHRLFLQVFDEGFLASGAGKRVYFSDAIIIMTANIDVAAAHRRPGFTGGLEAGTDLSALDKHFPREFVNRIDAICPFRALGAADVKRIIEQVTLPGWQRAQAHQDITLDITAEALDHLARAGYNSDLGARELHRVVESELLTKVSAQIVPGRPARLRALLRDGAIAVEAWEA